MRRSDLVSDCTTCAGLCCVATSFERSPEFALDKPFGVRCPNLRVDCRCAIHAELALRGFAGCTLFDCHGAGPRVTRAACRDPAAAASRDEAFLVSRELHELLWLLGEASRLEVPGRGALVTAIARTVAWIEEIVSLPLPEIAAYDVLAVRRRSRALLLAVGDALGGRANVRRSLPVVGCKP